MINKQTKKTIITLQVIFVFFLKIVWFQSVLLRKPTILFVKTLYLFSISVEEFKASLRATWTNTVVIGPW